MVSKELRRAIGALVLLLGVSVGSIAAQEIRTEAVAYSSLAAVLDETPFWLWALNDGLVEPDASSVRGGVAGSVSYEATSWLELDGAGSVVALTADDRTETVLRELNLRLGAGPLSVRAGRWERVLGEVYEPLSSGSMISSGNSLSPWMVQGGLLEYFPVPGVAEYVQVKGALAHGWLGEDRYVNDAYLHEKYGYIRLTPTDQLSFHAGLVHEAVWGGKSVVGSEYPDGFDDYVRVFLIKSGGSDAPPGEQLNRLGSHLGIWDFGAAWQTGRFWSRAYYQHYFEARSSSRFNNKADGLWGFAAGGSFSGLEVGALYELLLTKYQGGDVSHLDGGRQMYYENGIYRTGWTYKDYVIGSPLIGVTGREEDLSFYNSRVIGHHFGVSVARDGEWEFRHVSTVSNNYGRYYDNLDSRFDDGSLFQYSGLAELTLQRIAESSVSATFRIGWDVGELYQDTLGVVLEVEYAWN